VLIVGTGLTMVDLVVELAARGDRGWVHAVSRRGLVPQSHVPDEPYPPFLAASGLPRSITKQLALVRAEITRAAERGGGRARSDPLGLGLAVAPDGALIEADGGRSRSLFAVGPPVRDALWDITAVAEIRRQYTGWRNS
jgi:uncharacterized NAD(P)/FAD-binding protein YdhS